jgi:branched-chain amino acid transport system substrate-binding protein
MPFSPCLAELRRWVSMMVLALGALLLVTPAVAQDGAPIRIGVIASLTGGLADVNIGEINGLKLRLKQLGYQVAGRKIELVIEDDAGDPGVGVTKAQKLIDRDKVDVMLGPFLAHVVAATQDYVGKKGIPHLPLVGQTPENARLPNMVIPGWNAVQLGRMMGEYAVRNLGHKRASIVSSKYAYGTRTSDGFREGFTAAGGAIQKELYVPLGTADWAPFLSGLPERIAIFSAIPGADAIRYVKARHEFGQRDSMPLLGVIATVDGLLLPAMGDAATGAVAITHYYEELDVPQNKLFIEAYRKEYNKAPLSYYEALGYTIGQVLETALTTTKGNTDAGPLLAAIKAVDISTPQGRFRFDAEKRYPIMDYYFLKVAGKGGKPQYQVMDVLRDVRPE